MSTTEKLVGSIIEKDHAESLKAFQEVIASKLSAALENERMRVASSLIGESRSPSVKENASFNYAAAQAAVNGEDEFEFQGETYPVTMDLETAEEIVKESAEDVDTEIVKDEDVYNVVIDGDVISSHRTRKDAEEALRDFFATLQLEAKRRYTRSSSDEGNFFIQLQKAQDLDGNHELKFRRGVKARLDIDDINKVLKAFDNIEKARDKQRFRVMMYQSPEAFKKIADSLTDEGLPK